MKTLSDLIWNEEETLESISAISINCLVVNCGKGQPDRDANVEVGLWCLRIPFKDGTSYCASQ